MRILIDYDLDKIAICMISNFENTNIAIRPPYSECYQDFADIKNLHDATEIDRNNVKKALEIVKRTYNL